MFGWRKRNDGFEWHKYVRTTIKLRREARRDKAERLKDEAAARVAAAGVAAGKAAQAGARQLGAGSQHAARSLGTGLAHCVAGIGRGIANLGTTLQHRLTPLLRPMAEPRIAGPLAIVGAIALAAGFIRSRNAGLVDRDATITLYIGGAALLVACVPALIVGHGGPWPSLLQRLSKRVRGGVATTLAAGALAGSGWAIMGGPLRLPALPGMPAMPFITAATTSIEGRAVAQTGDTLRVGSATVRLVGIEAPERDQRCAKPGNKRWRCGEAAAAALSRLAQGRTLKCDVGKADAAGVAAGTCFDGATNINAALVKGGHVFADTGVLASYRAAEAEARVAKAGVWAGEADRPAIWRTKVWDEAKRKAPDGCPIKGRATGSGRAKVYVLPWQPEYERAAVSKTRGDRWFCTEEEAITAGWTVAGRN